VPRGRRDAVDRAAGPSAGSTAISGSGGNFLSNEIFYRTRLLRDASGSSVPMGHLHVPSLDNAGASATAAAINAARDTIVARIRQILVDTLPSL
jgi:pyrrolidone-carboxylate peptidase